MNFDSQNSIASKYTGSIFNERTEENCAGKDFLSYLFIFHVSRTPSPQGEAYYTKVVMYPLVAFQKTAYVKCEHFNAVTPMLITFQDIIEVLLQFCQNWMAGSISIKQFSRNLHRWV